jgi:hypothetical protein
VFDKGNRALPVSVIRDCLSCEWFFGIILHLSSCSDILAQTSCVWRCCLSVFYQGTHVLRFFQTNSANLSEAAVEKMVAEAVRFKKGAGPHMIYFEDFVRMKLKAEITKKEELPADPEPEKTETEVREQ